MTRPFRESIVRRVRATVSSRPRLWTILASVLLMSPLAACGGHGSSGPTYTLSGSVSHFDSGVMTLSDGIEALAVPPGATTFAFQHGLSNGAPYNVTVIVQPANETCVVSNGSGVIAGQDVQNIAVICNSALSAPTTLGVYPADLEGATDARVFLPVGQVGTQSVSINAVLDTGSAGVDLDALEVFPTSIVTGTGFVFPAGQTSLTYNGITVTNVTASRNYGGQGGEATQDVGNLGFAQMTVGGGTQVTTAVVPILFVYKHLVNGTAGPLTNFTNLVGINPGMGPLVVAGSPAVTAGSLAPCTPQSTTTCGAASPFRFLTYGGGVTEGYELAQVTLHQCTIATAGSCTQENALVLGLNADVTSGFSTTPLINCRSVAIPNANAASEPVCSQEIPNVQIASGGSSFTGPAIFDSGQPQVVFEVPPTASFPDTLPQGSTVSVTTPSSFSYQLQSGMGYANVIVNQNAGADNFSNLGIDYFTLHSLLVNYAQAMEGFK